MTKNLLHKGHRYIATAMRRFGYTLVDFNESTRIAEYAKTCAGITIDSVYITFSEAWRAIDIK